MDRIPRASELVEGDMEMLRGIIARTAVSTASVPKPGRERLLALGLISAGMGLVMPTPAGRIVARMLQ